MHVGRTAFDCVQKNFVDEADDRGGIDVVLRYVFLLFDTARNVEVFEIEIVVLERRHAGIDCLERLVDTFLELVLLDDHRIDTQAGLELHIVDSLQIRRVCNA